MRTGSLVPKTGHSPPDDARMGGGMGRARSAVGVRIVTNLLGNAIRYEEFALWRRTARSGGLMQAPTSLALPSECGVCVSRRPHFWG
jgi:hypothetical protein